MNADQEINVTMFSNLLSLCFFGRPTADVC